MKKDFVTVDVFTDTRFGGNPLAVVPDARGLSTQQMQAIAAEFNLSETTFVFPAKDEAHTAEVRIFTPRAEMPFAGHPNVGTAYVLAQIGECHGRHITGDAVTFEEKAGLVRIELLKRGGAIAGARLAAPQALTMGPLVEETVVEQACALSGESIETRRHPPRIASCGTPFVIAELKSRKALSAARPRADMFERHIPTDRATGILLCVPSSDDTASIHCRMFAPLHGVTEDPATGSAAVALIGLLAALDPSPDEELTRTLIQGEDMGRPSRLEAAARKAGSKVEATYVGGACVPVMKGVIDVV